MPVLRSIRERFARDRPLDGVRVAACLHVTAETACLVRTLEAGGATVGLTPANPLSTQDDVAVALGVAARRGTMPDPEDILDPLPHLTLDDGADLVALLHMTDRADGLRGGTEETTTGLVRVRRLDLKCPVIAVNEARTERLFNDHYGTGQSALDGILRATNLLIPGKVIVVLGYGETGRGIAARARGAGAHVIVCEVDPMRALEARMEGFEVMPALAAAERGDVFVTATGSRAVLHGAHFARMKHGAMLANAGHFDVEIKLSELPGEPVQVLPLVQQYDGRLNLLASGRVVNLAAGQGHPAEIMDLSFANQALAAEYLIRDELSPGVHPVPLDIDREIARLKLAALGVGIDTLTDEQRAYLSSWE